MDWQPIDTAPKSARAIMVYVSENQCTYIVTWKSGKDGGWMVFGGGWRDHVQRATYWMPLPEPPEPQS